MIAGLLLLGDQVQNGAVLDGLQLLCGNPAGLEAAAGILELLRTQKAADEIIAIRGCNILAHGFLLWKLVV